MFAPVTVEMFSAPIVWPAAPQLAVTSISSKFRSGASDDVIAFTNDVTCGLIISCAITRPAVVYGVTTRSAPASLSLRSASSLDPRAITIRSGRRDLTESVM